MTCMCLQYLECPEFVEVLTSSLLFCSVAGDGVDVLLETASLLSFENFTFSK